MGGQDGWKLAKVFAGSRARRPVKTRPACLASHCKNVLLQAERPACAPECCPAACKASSTGRWARCRTASSSSAASSSTVRFSHRPVCVVLLVLTLMLRQCWAGRWPAQHLLRSVHAAAGQPCAMHKQVNLCCSPHNFVPLPFLTMQTFSGCLLPPSWCLWPRTLMPPSSCCSPAPGTRRVRG